MSALWTPTPPASWLGFCGASPRPRAVEPGGACGQPAPATGAHTSLWPAPAAPRDARRSADSAPPAGRRRRGGRAGPLGAPCRRGERDGIVTAEGNGYPYRLVWDVRPNSDAVVHSQGCNPLPLHTDSTQAEHPHAVLCFGCVEPGGDGAGCRSFSPPAVPSPRCMRRVECTRCACSTDPEPDRRRCSREVSREDRRMGRQRRSGAAQPRAQVRAEGLSGCAPGAIAVHAPFPPGGRFPPFRQSPCPARAHRDRLVQSPPEAARASPRDRVPAISEASSSRNLWIAWRSTGRVRKGAGCSEGPYRCPALRRRDAIPPASGNAARRVSGRSPTVVGTSRSRLSWRGWSAGARC